MTAEQLELLFELISLQSQIAARPAGYGPSLGERDQVEALKNKLRATLPPQRPEVPVTVGMVCALRELTDAPMMECKAALKACNGDQAAASDWLLARRGMR